MLGVHWTKARQIIFPFLAFFLSFLSSAWVKQQWVSQYIPTTSCRYYSCYIQQGNCFLQCWWWWEGERMAWYQPLGFSNLRGTRIKEADSHFPVSHVFVLLEVQRVLHIHFGCCKAWETGSPLLVLLFQFFSLIWTYKYLYVYVTFSTLLLDASSQSQC